VILLDRQGWLTALVAVRLSLITLFTGCSHSDLLGAERFAELDARLSAIVSSSSSNSNQLPPTYDKSET
jgi:hypothetical protein